MVWSAGAWIATVLACSTPTPCDPPGTQVSEPRAAGCLTVRDHRILLVKSRSGAWSIPGGYVEGGETSAQAAVRETREEAGIPVKAGGPACAAPRKRFVAHVCTAAAGLEPSADGTETIDARFFTAAELQALPEAQLRFPAQRAAYLRAIARDRTPSD